MSDTNEYLQLAGFLKDQGHTEQEIEKILTSVQQYEIDTQLFSVMDAIGSGELDLARIIQDALTDTELP